MTDLLTAAQMRAIEAAAIASGKVTGLELMERAGHGVVAAIFEKWPDLRAASHRAVVLCGPGGNGGDGFVVARLLRDWGWQVDAFLYGDPQRLPPDARVNYQRWLETGKVNPAPSFDPERHAGDLYIDAIFGSGLTRAIDTDLEKLLADVIGASYRFNGKRVAVDFPTGICSDSGRARGFPFSADLTVTFAYAKTGHFLADGPEYCDHLVIRDIGLSRRFLQDTLGRRETAAKRMTVDYSTIVSKPDSGDLQPGFSSRFSILDKAWHSRDTHKYAHGHALVLSGPTGRGGAGRLAARGALRIGAGVVTVGCPPDAVTENAARLDAVMLREVADGAGLAAVLEDRRITALGLGPGMGTGVREAGLVAAALGAPVPGPGRDLMPDVGTRTGAGPGSGPGQGLPAAIRRS